VGHRFESEETETPGLTSAAGYVPLPVDEVVPDVAFARRSRPPQPYAWAGTVGHLAFVGIVVAAAVFAPSEAARVAVLGAALAYAALVAGRRPAPEHEVELSLGDAGVRQTVDGRTDSVAWSELHSYVTPLLALDAIGLRGRDGRVRIMLGQGFENGVGPVAHRLWRAIALAVRARLPYDGSPADPAWRRLMTERTARIALAFGGVGFAFAPTLFRNVAQAMGAPGALAALLVVLGVGYALIARLFARGQVKDVTTAVTTDWDEREGELDAFLAARSFRLDPVEMEVGRIYRYPDARKLANSLSDAPYGNAALAYIALVQAVSLVPGPFFQAAIYALPLGALGHYLLCRPYRRALVRGRDACFSVEEGELVVRWEDREERYPLPSARAISLRRDGFEFGGEVWLLRVGRRRIALDRRFLQPVAVPHVSDVAEPMPEAASSTPEYTE
jgi:hypothetical protein